jgi:uncharacterized membrane protein YeiH
LDRGVNGIDLHAMRTDELGHDDLQVHSADADAPGEFLLKVFVQAPFRHAARDGGTKRLGERTWRRLHLYRLRQGGLIQRKRGILACVFGSESLPALPPAFDYAGVHGFRLDGRACGCARQQDIVTFWFFAVVTGVGGGTLRDLLIGAPVFWIGDATYLGIGLLAAIAVWFAAPRLERAKTLIWLDAVGLGVYAVIGAAKAMSFGVGPFVSIAMGVLTACFGGVIRDVLAEQPSALLKREITISAALLAAGGFVALTLCGHSAALGGRRRRDRGFWIARRRHTLWLGAAGVRRQT